MKCKKLGTVLLAFALFMMQLAPAAFADENPFHSMPSKKGILANVAQYKPVSGAEGMYIEAGYPIERLVDGNSNICTIVGLSGTTYLQVDLLRRYKVEKIEVTSRYETDHGVGTRANIKVLGSDDPDFSEGNYDVLANSGDGSVFPHQGIWEIELDGAEDYRYIRLARDDYQYSGFGELKVYAKFDATEVSRNKTAIGNAWYETNNYDWAAPQTTLDGNEGSMEAWITYNNVGYNYMQVDLDEPYHIGYIEMTARPGDDSSAAYFYQAYDIYGSNHAIDTDEEKAYVLAADAPTGVLHLDADRGYNVLARSLTADRYIGGLESDELPWTPFKAFAESVDDTTAYQYLTYKHTYQLGTMMGLFKAYTINPSVNSTERDGNHFTINFSDDMEFSDVSDVISVIGSDGEVELSNIEEDDYTVSFDADVELGKTYTLSISKDATNKYGVPMLEDYNEEVRMPAVIDITGFEFYNPASETKEAVDSLSGLSKIGARVSIQNNSLTMDENAILIIMLYDENGYFVTAEQMSALIETGETEPISAEVSLPTGKDGMSAKAILWNKLDIMTSWTPQIIIK